MNILWVSLYPPLPLNFGGPIGIYHRMRELVKRNNSVYLFYINEDNDPDYDRQLAHFCKEVHSYPRLKKTNLKVLFDCLRYPYTVATRNISRMKEDIEKCICDERINIINVEFPQMCINILGISSKYNIPVILHEHNNEWNRFIQMSESSKGIRRLLLLNESKKLYNFEKYIEKNGIVNNYSFLSTDDLLRHIETFGIDESRAFLVPLGGEMREITNIPHDGFNFVFCAAMDSEMNDEGALWFSKDILPYIKRSNIKFYIVGRNPSDRIKKLQSEIVIVTGMVDSMEYYYGIADAIVIPLLHGGGVKVKLLEAIERGKLIITTPRGVEGTQFTEEHMYIARDKDDFIKKCQLAIENQVENEIIVRNMIEFFEENYTWSSIGEAYETNIQRCITEMRENSNESK